MKGIVRRSLNHVVICIVHFHKLLFRAAIPLQHTQQMSCQIAVLWIASHFWTPSVRKNVLSLLMWKIPNKCQVLCKCGWDHIQVMAALLFEDHCHYFAHCTELLKCSVYFYVCESLRGSVVKIKFWMNEGIHVLLCWPHWLFLFSCVNMLLSVTEAPTHDCALTVSSFVVII